MSGSGDSDEKLQWSIKNGDADAVKNIIEKDHTLANKPYAGRTPLCVAADYNQEDVISYLLSKGANVNTTDKHGITPLLSAIYEGHTSCVKLLLSKGADKTLKAPDGSSYVECAEQEDIRALLK